MKLASFSTVDIPKTRIGIVQGNEIVDVDLAARALNIMPYEQMLDLLDHSEEGMRNLRVILDKAAGRRFTEVKTFTYIGTVQALYTVLHDVTARDLQARHKQVFKGKTIDGYCPMGPWIVTADEIPDPQKLTLRLCVNDVTKQEGNTSMMIFPVRTIIAVLSKGMTIEPGDIIATGTPSGVGFARNPPEYLRAGDVMETEIEGIGTLRNVVIKQVS